MQSMNALNPHIKPEFQKLAGEILQIARSLENSTEFFHFLIKLESGELRAFRISGVPDAPLAMVSDKVNLKFANWGDQSEIAAVTVDFTSRSVTQQPRSV